MSLVSDARRQFHSELLADVLLVDKAGVASNADKDSRLSRILALDIADQLRAELGSTRLPGQTSGSKFESAVGSFLSMTFLRLGALRPGEFRVRKVGSRARAVIASFDQYAHLTELSELAEDNPSLAVALGADYLVAPDVVIERRPEPDSVLNSGTEVVDEAVARLTPLREANGSLPSLHASISCKWTLRSDRAQNAKSEALNLVRHRKGKLPHVVAVTGEPLPTRIAALALGTGDLDCVYHFALYELQAAVGRSGDEGSMDMLRVLVEGKRLKDVSDLPLDLVI